MLVLVWSQCCKLDRLIDRLENLFWSILIVLFQSYNNHQLIRPDNFDLVKFSIFWNLKIQKINWANKFKKKTNIICDLKLPGLKCSTLSLIWFICCLLNSINEYWLIHMFGLNSLFITFQLKLISLRSLSFNKFKSTSSYF